MIDQKAKEYAVQAMDILTSGMIDIIRPTTGAEELVRGHIEAAYRAGWRDGQAEFYKRERVDEGLNHSLRGMT